MGSYFSRMNAPLPAELASSHSSALSFSAAVASAAMLYFWARVVHALAYTLAWPWVRTLAFAAGFVAQMMVAWQILAR